MRDESFRPISHFSFALFALQTLRHQLRDILPRDFLVHAQRLRAIVEHRHTERARGRDRLRVHRNHVFDARVVDALAGVLFQPHSSAAAAAAQTVRARARHFHQVAVRAERAQNRALRLVDVVVATQVARIVIRDA